MSNREYKICEKCGLRIYGHREQTHLCEGEENGN